MSQLCLEKCHSQRQMSQPTTNVTILLWLPIVRARDDLTLFCDIYNVFLMFLIDFFVLNSNPMSASLKSLSIFVDSRSTSRSNMIFQEMKLGTSVIPHFYAILTGQSISETILIIEGHLQGQSQGQVREYISFNK